jgi:dienelactone hydrolase
MRYAQAGAVSVLVRPEPWKKKIYTVETSAEQDRDGIAQAVVDLRRAIDLLLARPDVDPKRVAYIGHSYGAQFGAILTAIDHRMATSILMAGIPGSAALWFDSDDPDEVDFRKTVGIDALKKELEVTGALDAIRFIPFASPIPLLFQFAQFDRFSVESMRSYADAATGPKQVLWYPRGHALNDPTISRHAPWNSRALAMLRLEREVPPAPICGPRCWATGTP